MRRGTIAYILLFILGLIVQAAGAVDVQMKYVKVRIAKHLENGSGQ